MSFGENINQLIECSENPHLQIHPSWERVRLGDIADILNGAPWKSQYFNSTDGVPVIRIRDVTSGATNTRYNGPTNDGPWVETGDLLVGMDGDFNVRRWKSHKGLLNQRVCKISISKSLYSSRFIEYILPSYLAVINQATSSVTVKHLSSRTLNDLPIPLPPLTEQHRIVAKLDSLTTRIAHARAELERVRLLSFKAWKSAISEAFKKVKCDNVPLKQIVQITGGLTKNAKRSSLPLQVPYLRVANVYANELRLNDVAEIGCSEKEYKKTKLEKNDILIVEGNGSIDQVGRAAIWNSEIDGCTHQNHLIRIRPNKAILSQFLLFFLESSLGRKYIETSASSTSGLHTLSISKIGNFLCPLPSRLLQDATVKHLNACRDRLSKKQIEIDRALTLLDRLESSLLAKAFQGELVPQDPTDEPASVLLDRIRAERAAAPKPKRGRRQSTQDVSLLRKR